MSAHAKSLILKAQDDLDLAKKHVDDEKQHDLVGYNLAQACEKYLKALCDMRGLSYPEDDHDLDALMSTLEEANFSAISSHADVIELTPYNSANAHIREDERLDMEEYITHVENLKKLVGEQLKLL
ncbi:HEPN domain-containing protein [Bdellovibrio reynosensis]|uniref:HEPN domain-containing protein n=1 Tax=Bdellovibrio reynosensis TaxID=2835041 RepID=A0ABY4C7Z7_9BACT|nr:HEPN domain-containing protein [Bdellovibrio reynosensis]UOE99740.1 HEPN domain-containing protein [Bdellovibrio reynosensis]